MSKILLYQEPTSGVTTNGTQHALFINENGIPAVKNGSQVITFGTSGYAFAGSSGSSGMNGTNGLSGTSGFSGTSGQDGAPGDIGPAGSNGSSGMSGTSGINGIDGVSGTSGISYGTSGISGTSGVSLGAKSKAGSIPITGFTYNATTGTYDYDVIFAEAYNSTAYSVSTNLVDGTIDSQTDPYSYYPIWTSEKTVSGFTINALNDPSFYPTITVEWMTISQGETGVAVAGTSGTSGTSPAGGNGGDTLYTQYVGLSTDQPTIAYGAKMWHSIYGDGLQLDQGSGGAYDGIEVGFIQPFFLAPGENVAKVGFYFMDYISSGTGSFKLIICDKHPAAYLPWNILHSEELTLTHDGVGNKFVSWDYDFTNTGTTTNTYFFYILFQNEATRTFEICRTVQYPQQLTYDYRLITSDNRFNSGSHWVTAYHNIYNSLPSTMSGLLSSNFYFTNQRGGHIYYQSIRP